MMRKIELLLLVCFAALAFVANARPHFSISYGHDTVPLYSRQSESARYKVGESVGRYKPDVTIGKVSFEIYEDSIKYEFCRNKNWTKLKFRYYSSGYRTKVVYVPTKYFTVEYYEEPVVRDDGIAAYELLEDKYFVRCGSQDSILLSKGEVVNVNRLYDNGIAECRYREELGNITSSNIAPTDKEYVIPFFKSRLWRKIKDVSALWLLVLVPLALAIVCDRIYKWQLFERGKQMKFLDSLAGIFFMATVAAGYYVYDEMTGDSLCGTLTGLVPVVADFWYMVVMSLGLLLLYFVWVVIVRFCIRFGANWTMHVTTFLFFALLTLYAVGDVIDKTGLWGIVGLFAIPFISFIGYMVIYFKYINFYRCPVCHATGGDEVKECGTDDMGISKSHSTDTKLDTHYNYIWVEEKYDVETTRQHYRTYMHCNKCGTDYNVDTSRVIGEDRNLKSWEIRRRS